MQQHKNTEINGTVSEGHEAKLKVLPVIKFRTVETSKRIITIISYNIKSKSKISP